MNKIKPCYFQGCNDDGITKEHIPPKSFFPDGEKEQLLTVPSCKKHNNDKSADDFYALMHICMHASPKNRAGEVFEKKVESQLISDSPVLFDKLMNGCSLFPDGRTEYDVEVKRFDDFFTALTCGIIFKSYGASLPECYRISHIYHDFDYQRDPTRKQFEDLISSMYSGQPAHLLKFGAVNTQNQNIYTVKIFGMPDFKSSITLVHTFFGCFKVTSMLGK